MAPEDTLLLSRTPHQGQETSTATLSQTSGESEPRALGRCLMLRLEKGQVLGPDRASGEGRHLCAYNPLAFGNVGLLIKGKDEASKPSDIGPHSCQGRGYEERRCGSRVLDGALCTRA